MAFGKSGRAVRAYRYGCLAPREGWEAAQEQHRLRVRYWNALVELERERRERVEQLIAAQIGEVEEDEQRQSARRAAFKDASVRERLKALDREVYERAKALRNEEFVPAGLWFGNYMDVEANWRVACKGRDAPRFQRYDPREGKISVLTTNGLPVGALEESTMVRLEPIERWSERAGKKHERARLLRVRIGSDPPGSRNAVWLSLPVILHRPLPADGDLRETHVTWRRRGTKLVYSVSFVVARDAEPATECEGPVVAVDLGWRLRSADERARLLRAGYWVGEDGDEGEILLDRRWLDGMAKVDDLQSLRDQHRDAIHAALIGWLDAAPGVPDWLAEERRNMARWESPARFAALCLRWRERRFPGDDAGYELLEAWRQRDKHLLEYQEHYRAQLLARRQDLYRVVAARLSRRYSRVVIEDFDLREVARLDAGNTLHPAARRQRQLAAVSSLRGALINAFERDHGKGSVLIVPAEYTTLTCAHCGQVDEGWDPAAAVEHRCRHCGARWDQDRNAAVNLLARANLSSTADSREVRAA